jgi:hypothetical protein
MKDGLEQYKQQQAQGFLQQLNQWPPGIAARDTRPMRVRLEEVLKHDRAEMDRLAQRCDDISRALTLLDQNPAVEQLGDLLRRIMG